MTVDEARRSHLYSMLAAATDEEAASTMFDLLPPVGTDLATRADIQRLEQRFDRVDERFVTIADRFEQIDRRFEQIDRRFEQIDEQLIGLRHDLTMAVAGQTRAMFLGMITAVAAIAGLSYTFAQLF